MFCRPASPRYALFSALGIIAIAFEEFTTVNSEEAGSSLLLRRNHLHSTTNIFGAIHDFSVKAEQQHVPLCADRDIEFYHDWLEQVSLCNFNAVEHITNHEFEHILKAFHGSAMHIQIL